MSLKQSWKYYPVEMIVLICVVFIFVPFVIYSAYSASEEQDKELSVDLTNCEKVGTAADQGQTYAKLRTIYKCNDGMIHIR